MRSGHLFSKSVARCKDSSEGNTNVQNLKFIHFFLSASLSVKYPNIYGSVLDFQSYCLRLNITSLQGHTSWWLLTGSTWISLPISCNIHLLLLGLLHSKLDHSRHVRYDMNKGIKVIVMLFLVLKAQTGSLGTLLVLVHLGVGQELKIPLIHWILLWYLQAWDGDKGL